MPLSPVRNVLLILTDQHRASATGYSGDPLAFTPSLDRLAARSAIFASTHTPSPVCVPARQSLITGRLPHAHGALTNAQFLGPQEVTLGHLASGASFATGAIGKMHFSGPERHYGFSARWDYQDYARVEPRAAGDAASGMAYIGRYGERAPGHDLPTLAATNPLDRAYWAGPSSFPAAAHAESYVTRESIRFLEQHRHERFLLICSYFKPHDPMTPPAEYWDRYATREIPLPPPANLPDQLPAVMHQRRRTLGVEPFDDDAWRAAIRGYYANLAFVDHQIGEVLASLDSLGLRDDTLILYTSDHGELLGHPRHPRHAGKQVFYDAAWRVPLLISHPGIETPAREVSALADLVDLFPTITTAAGLPLPEGRHGTSLLPLLAGARESVRDHVSSQLHARNATRPHYGVRTADWKLALYEPGEEQLFHLPSDPTEALNLYATHPEEVAQLRDLLAQDLALS